MRSRLLFSRLLGRAKMDAWDWGPGTYGIFRSHYSILVLCTW